VPVEDDDERRRRLIAKGILSPPQRPRANRKSLSMPPGPMISQEVMDRVWREERDGR
jgi:hypothetical protein